ncbi:nicotinamide riboside transporter PnuC [Tannockella kyphosi]|uniref:nicotinamide riboside transporter PnuC n=1 Tax=Tannockella kyphosi TaxID=2899121 RepID=UPI002010E3DF|nr:nicotinamide riboside transporter PnuC [Tannockella kyphosi]
MKKMIFCFNKIEMRLWILSITIILSVNIFHGNIHYLSLFTTLLGITGLLYLARGNVLGQIITVVFSILYGYISYQFGYYGEMLTYLCMTGPMALLATIEWLKNPYQGSIDEVEVANLTKPKFLCLCFLTMIVTILFYFVLKYFNTQNLIVSVLSIFTSFMAVGLTYLRSHYYAIAYAFNDIILIILWLLATIQNSTYLTMVLCFCVFLVNDLYAYYNWKKMKEKQKDNN